MTKIFSIITYVLLLYIDGITQTADVTENPLFFFFFKLTKKLWTVQPCLLATSVLFMCLCWVYQSW